MSIFKKKIYFPQFLADLVTHQMDFLEKNFDKLIVMADESGLGNLGTATYCFLDIILNEKKLCIAQPTILVVCIIKEPFT